MSHSRLGNRVIATILAVSIAACLLLGGFLLVRSEGCRQRGLTALSCLTQ